MEIDRFLEQKIKRIEKGLLPHTENLKISKHEPMNLHERMESYNVPGVSVALINDAVLEWTGSYGRLEVDTDIQTAKDSIFNACSVSKFVTSITVLRLVQKGVLDLDEDVNVKLLSWNVPENEFTRCKKVTLRNILSHQAGFVDKDGSFGIYQEGDCVPSPLDILNGSTTYNPRPVLVEYIPGSRFEYSDAGFCVIEQLLVDLTGKLFEEIVKENVFRPLGMNNSHFLCEFTDIPCIAVGHNKHGKVVDGKRGIYPYMAAAGLWSTATDLALLVVELLELMKDDGKLQICSSLARDMITQQGCAEWAGLGLILNNDGGELRVESLGWGVGAQCKISAYPYIGSGVVVMTNSEPGCHQDKALIGELIQSIENEYRWIEI